MCPEILVVVCWVVCCLEGPRGFIGVSEKGRKGTVCPEHWRPHVEFSKSLSPGSVIQTIIPTATEKRLLFLGTDAFYNRMAQKHLEQQDRVKGGNILVNATSLSDSQRFRKPKT